MNPWQWNLLGKCNSYHYRPGLCPLTSNERMTRNNCWFCSIPANKQQQMCREDSWIYWSSPGVYQCRNTQTRTAALIFKGRWATMRGNNKIITPICVHHARDHRGEFGAPTVPSSGESWRWRLFDMAKGRAHEAAASTCSRKFSYDQMTFNHTTFKSPTTTCCYWLTYTYTRSDRLRVWAVFQLRYFPDFSSCNNI